MKIKDYKYTPDEISYIACYDSLEVNIVHERTEYGVCTTDIYDFLEEVSIYSPEDADAIEAFRDFQNNLVLEDVEFEIENAKKVTKLTILNWEHGTHEIKGSDAKKLADYFDVSIPYLLGYDTDNTLSDLINKINHWADERSLKQADPKIQWMRVTEEVGEIRDVLLKPTKFTEPQAALKDAIGDTLVTIIVLAHQLDLDVTECLDIAYEEIKNRNGKMINGTFVKEEDL